MAELTWKGKRSPLTHLTSSPSTLHTQHSYSANTQEPDSAPSDDGWHNLLIHGERSNVLRHLISEYAGSISLIYIDPPFMTGRVFVQGKQIAYSDQWNSPDEYIQWLYETFVLLHELLAETGSLYVHLDWRATHYARLLLDEIFQYRHHERGRGTCGGFQNEIIWHYQSGGRSSRHYARKHDTILWYTKSANYCFHPERIGEPRGTQSRNHMRKEVTGDGQVRWTIRSGGRLYTYNEETLLTPSDVWTDIHHLHQKDPERTGYATQKPASLLERIVLASSEENDLVLDCFCGSGVTPVVAERLGRRWIASDQSERAIDTTLQRLLKLDRQHPFMLQQLFNEESAPR